MKKLKKLAALFLVAAMVVGLVFTKEEIAPNEVYAAGTPTNGTIMQYFEWYSGDKLWEKVASEAANLGKAGFTALWLPPAYKGASGGYSSGYDPYDIYDLGEFGQKGSTSTKYGSLAQYTNAINKLHQNGVSVYADVVLNHMMGADQEENVSANISYGNDRNHLVDSTQTIGAWTKFNFQARNNKYSSFKWNYTCFDGVDYDSKTNKNEIYLFKDKHWDWTVDTENANYDYLMGADIDFDNTSVVNELKKWGTWYVGKVNLDGFRLDAVKHIKFEFYKDWLTYVRNKTGKELFTVGEYYSGDVGKLNYYIQVTGGTMSLFDFPLRNNFKAASDSGYGGGGYDMGQLFSNTLVSSNSTHAVTFVENHDLQPGREGDNYMGEWFKPLAYTAILTREGGYPCVFYGDYYGSTHKDDNGKTYSISPMKTIIDKLMKARTAAAYGTQHDYMDDHNVVGWTREGTTDKTNSGLAALITDGDGGSKKMYVGTSNAGETWYDITGNCSGNVKIDSEGYGNFSVNGGSCSVWVNTGIKVDVSQGSSNNNGNTTPQTTAPNNGEQGGSNSNQSNSGSNQLETNKNQNSDALGETTALADDETTNEADDKDDETENESDNDESIDNEETKKEEETNDTSEESTGSTTGKVVGIVVGASVLLSGAAVGLVYLFKKKKIFKFVKKDK